MEKLQITKGEYKSEIADDDTFAQVSHRDYTVLTVQGTHNHNDEKEHNDIALLSADALNTYQQCETLPSELLRQNREMKEALERITEIANDRYELATTRLALIDARCENCLTSCNKVKE